jgi:very-short-patch-repair endonuclease
LKLLGYEVVRFTWRQVTDDSSTVASTVRSLLNGR